jgi:hypothetical protein
LCEPGRNNGTHPLVMAGVVFDMASLVTHIAQFLEMEDMQMSFKGINMACHDAYRQRLKAFKEQPAADQLAYLLKLMAQGKNTGGTKIVLQRHIFTMVLPENYPAFQHIWSTNKGRQLVGRLGVYFTKSAAGLLVYDDVRHKYPVRIPARRLGDLAAFNIKYTAPSVRSIEVDTSQVTKQTPLSAIVGLCRSHLPTAGFSWGGLPIVQTGETYKVVYLSQKHERAARRKTVKSIRIAATDYLLCHGLLCDNRRIFQWKQGDVDGERVIGAHKLS